VRGFLINHPSPITNPPFPFMLCRAKIIDGLRDIQFAPNVQNQGFFFSFSFSFSLSLSNQPNFFQKDIPQDFFESSSDEEDADQPDERITRKSRFSRPPLGAIVNPAAVVFGNVFLLLRGNEGQEDGL